MRVLANDLVDRRDRGEPGIPDRLRVVRPNRFTSSVRRASVTIVRCALVCPVSVVGTATAFEHDDAFAGLGQQIGGGETGDAAADDDDVGVGILGELGKLRKRGGRRPVRVWCLLFVVGIVDSSSASRLGVRRMHGIRFR